MKGKWRVMSWLSAGFLAAAMLVPLTLHSARNVVMGKLEFEGKSGTVRDSGVWIDGQYVGYMKGLVRAERAFCCFPVNTRLRAPGRLPGLYGNGSNPAREYPFGKRDDGESSR